ncbi:MAG: hypothetical protein IIA87_01335 [Nanoarchaeota archaeon]|nr:hypothetical protein [Nanoarchaeota archaeon]
MTIKKRKINEFDDLERQLKRVLKILSIFVYSVVALAFIGLVYALYLAR